MTLTYILLRILSFLIFFFFFLSLVFHLLYRFYFYFIHNHLFNLSMSLFGMFIIFKEIILEKKIVYLHLANKTFFFLNTIKQKIRTKTGIFFPIIWIMLRVFSRYIILLVLLHFLNAICFKLGFLVQVNGIFLYTIHHSVLILPDYNENPLFFSFYFVWSSFILPDEALIILHVEGQEFTLFSFEKRE